MEKLLVRFDKKKIGKEEWSKVKNQVWGVIPGVEKDFDIRVLEEVSRWALPIPMMSRVPELVKEISYTLSMVTGMNPKGQTKFWIKQMNELWEAAGHNEEILRSGLREGEEKRREEDRVYVEPMAYLSSIRNYRAKVMKAGLNG